MTVQSNQLPAANRRRPFCFRRLVEICCPPIRRSLGPRLPWLREVGGNRVQ
jgi:hypothetical protein